MALAAELAYLEWLAGEELTRQKNVQQARDYYAGDHAVPLTDRQAAYLGFQKGGRFAANYCATVVNAVTERMIVTGVACQDDAVHDWAWQVWGDNRGDALQMDVHQAAIRDGETFVMVDWDGTRPRLTFHPRYVSSQAGGDGFGCKAFYPNGDHRQPMLYATKRWTETVEAARSGDRPQRSQTRQRLTVYYPERVEKYALTTTNEAGWAPFAEEDGGAWPVTWVDGLGRPLGIPVLHFRNADMRSELWDAIPLQDAINKALLDLLAGQDTAGFRIFFARGFFATTDGNPPASDGSNYLKLAPGQIVGTGATEAEFTPIEPADLKPMIESFWAMVLTLAQVTDTPVNRFQVTRQIAGAETQKQGEEPLLAKIRARQVLIGNAWEDLLSLARRVANTFGGAGLDESARMEMQWAPAATRDEEKFFTTLALKHEKIGVPLEQIWREAGYSQDEIDAMVASQEMQARLATMKLATVLATDRNG
jgi:hypothetical protein